MDVLLVVMLPEGKLTCFNLVVRFGGLLAGMCTDLVFVAALYRVLRRYPRNTLLVHRRRDYM